LADWRDRYVLRLFNDGPAALLLYAALLLDASPAATLLLSGAVAVKGEKFGCALSLISDSLQVRINLLTAQR
jgi:hypothetical protein